MRAISLHPLFTEDREVARLCAASMRREAYLAVAIRHGDGLLAIL